MAPNKKGAPAKYILVPGLVKKENKNVITNGPIIVVTLIRLVSAPCNSPCSFFGILPEMILCNAGPAMPPRQYGIKKAYIIQPCVARPNKIKPIA